MAKAASTVIGLSGGDRFFPAARSIFGVGEIACRSCQNAERDPLRHRQERPGFRCGTPIRREPAGLASITVDRPSRWTRNRAATRPVLIEYTCWKPSLDECLCPPRSSGVTQPRGDGHRLHRQAGDRASLDSGAASYGRPGPAGLAVDHEMPTLKRSSLHHAQSGQSTCTSEVRPVVTWRHSGPAPTRILPR